MKNTLILAILFILFSFMNSNAQKSIPSYPLTEGLLLVEKSENSTVWLGSLMRADHHENVYAPPLRTGEYYLVFSTISIFNDTGLSD